MSIKIRNILGLSSKKLEPKGSSYYDNEARVHYHTQQYENFDK